jgi:hypothetical protein
LELCPRPPVDADIAAPAALASSEQDRASVRIGLAECVRLADPQAGTPEHDDHAAEAEAVGIITRGLHDGDDLLDGRGSGGCRKPLLRGGSPWWKLVLVWTTIDTGTSWMHRRIDAS